MDEPWVAPLRAGRTDEAWAAFLERYRRLIFATIRHYTRDYDDGMDVFAHVCEALRADESRRLRAWADGGPRTARFSTWLVTVVRHLVVDWFRVRDGRRRLPALFERLPPRQRRLAELLFVEHRSHMEAYELLQGGAGEALTFRAFQAELREVHRALTAGHRGFLLRELAPLPAAALDRLPAPEPPAEAAASPAQLEAALATLGAEDRVIVELFVVEEMPAADVARIVGLPNAKAVYNRAYRALAALRAWLEARGVDPTIA